MSSGVFSGLVTGVLLVLFIGLCVWAWSARRHKDFRQAERLPLDDEDRSDS